MDGRGNAHDWRLVVRALVFQLKEKRLWFGLNGIKKARLKLATTEGVHDNTFKRESKNVHVGSTGQIGDKR